MTSLGAEMSAMIPTSDGILAFFMMFGGILLFALIVGAIILTLLYRHKLVIRHIVDGRPGGVQIVKCREYRDEMGNYFWAPFLKPSIPHAPKPKGDYIAMTTKGKWLAEAYLDAGNYIWVKPSIRDNKKFAELDIFNGTQRWAYQTRIKVAQRKRENWKTMLLPLAGAGMCLLCLVLLVVFYDDATDKPIEMQNLANDGIKQINELTKQNAAIAEQNNKALELMMGLYEDPDFREKMRERLPEEPPR